MTFAPLMGLCYTLSENMDVEKTIEFLLDHHARFAADLDLLKERQDRFDREQQQLKETVTEVAKSVAALAKSVTVMELSVNRLIDVVAENSRQIAENSQQVKGLTQKQSQTDENLNALIKVVDDLIRRDGGRRPNKRKPQ